MLLAALVSAAPLHAQDNLVHNSAFWPGYEGYHPFMEGQPWGLMLEGYWKRANFVGSGGWRPAT